MTRGETSNPTATPQPRASWLLGTLPYASLAGFTGLVVNALLSFEEPQREMLLVSGLLLMAAPLGVLLHLTLTHELTRAQKRAWAAGLLGTNGFALFAAYLRNADRHRATRRLEARRRSRRTSG